MLSMPCLDFTTSQAISGLSLALVQSRTLSTISSKVDVDRRLKIGGRDTTNFNLGNQPYRTISFFAGMTPCREEFYRVFCLLPYVL